jgi:cbb3-type cytochrome oxidase subunit 3
MDNYTFKMFLGRNWWFFIMGLASIFRQSERGNGSGSAMMDLLFGMGIVLVILYVYWFIRYGSKQDNNQTKDPFE